MTRSKATLAIFLVIVFCLMFTSIFSQSLNDIRPEINKSVPTDNFNQKKKNKKAATDTLLVEIDSLKGMLSFENKGNLQLKDSIRVLNNKMKITNSDLADFKKYSPIAGLAFCCALIGLTIYSMRSKKRTHVIKANVNKLNEEKFDILNELEVKKKEYEILLSEKKTLNEQLNTLKLQQSILNQAVNKRNFFSQVLLSAGPRKSTRDTELGEDTAGFCIDGNRAFFWVLDGTSDSSILSNERKEIMSSRLLAQHLGVNLQKTISSGELDSQYWLKKAITATQEQWQQTFLSLPEDDKKSVEKKLAETANIAYVSTTALVGILNIDGKASIARVGDSKAFCFDHEGKLIEDSLAQKPSSDSYSRLFARAILDQDTINIQFATSDDQLRLSYSTSEGVKTVLAFSDGIGPITENFLREHFNKIQLEDVQKSIVNIPQQTFDDKSLVMIQIR